jgi:predicted ATPase
MPEVATDFRSLPEEYQQVIRLAEETHKITVAPLQLLVGGWSGAVVYLVSISNHDTKRVEHCVLKVDRKGKNAKSDEVTRHNAVMAKSTPEFVHDHIAELAFDRVERDGAIAIFYRIAGQSLHKYRPLSSFERQSQLRTIFSETNKVLLTEWNSLPAFETMRPQEILQKWLAFRLDSGGNIERFLRDACRVNPDAAGLLVNGHVFPNPLSYARKVEQWGDARSIDTAIGSIHGDLNTNNILVRFAEDKESLAGYYLIDFALFKDGMPLFYDQRYLEMSYLMHAASRVSFARCIDFLTLLAVADVPDPHKVPIEMSGVCGVIGSARDAFGAWVQEAHPSLHDDLWGQYWLAGVASGLGYCHKIGISDEQRLAGLIYAATNLKRYAATFNMAAPTNVEPIHDPKRSDSGPSTIRRLSHNLPAQPTPFIGRQSEMAAVQDLLRPDRDYVRLVTLTGPGGTGKTRLAIQAALALVNRFPDGLCFVDLAPVREPEAVLTTVARTLGIRETSDRPLLDELRSQLQSKAMLLLLDNFEQVTAAAPKVGDLLQDCPQLKLLATSREPLHLRGEHIYPVPPLALPRDDLKQQSLAQLTQSEAVRLFIERVMAVKPDFDVTQANAAAVADICLRLDGLPLAIELAAARMRLFSLRDLLERVGGRLQLLRGGARDLPIRQQTLRHTIDWSFELLSAGEQKLFALLSVFAGCPLQAAEAVAVGMNHYLDGMALDVLEGMASLVDKSLVRQTEQDTGEARFLMLETIREYATERLEQDREFSTAAHRAHANYFADFAQRQWERLSGDGREAALREMDSDIENLRIAWHYWVERKDLEQLNKFVDGLLLLHDARGWYHATVGLTNDLLSVLAATPSTPERVEQQILLQTSLARAVMATKGYTEEAEQAYVRALELFESAGDVPQLFPVLRGLASLLNFRNQPDKARQLGERMLDLAERLDDVDMKIEGLVVTGYNQSFAGSLLGLELLEKGIALSRSQRRPTRALGIGPDSAVVALNVSALFLWAGGCPDRAYDRAAEAIALAQRLNHPYSLTYAQFHHGLLHMWLRNHETARSSAEAVVELAEVYGFQIWSAVGSCLRGAALANIGRIAEGLRLTEQGLETYRGLKTPPVFWPLLLHLCAGAYGAASRPEDGLPLLDEALASEKSGSSDGLASEFLILKGDLLGALSSDNTVEAESLYRSALDNARAGSAAMVELRAAMRLSRLWQSRGRPEQARELLIAAYSKISEGFTTADMKDARALLDTLSS